MNNIHKRLIVVATFSIFSAGSALAHGASGGLYLNHPQGSLDRTLSKQITAFILPGSSTGYNPNKRAGVAIPGVWTNSGNSTLVFNSVNYPITTSDFQPATNECLNVDFKALDKGCAPGASASCTNVADKFFVRVNILTNKPECSTK